MDLPLLCFSELASLAVGCQCWACEQFQISAVTGSRCNTVCWTRPALGAKQWGRACLGLVSALMWYKPLFSCQLFQAFAV